MKIALIKPNLEGKGGLEKWTLRIAEDLMLKGFDTTILTSGTHSKDLPFPIQWFKTTRWPPSFKIDQFDKKTTAWLKKNSFDRILGMERNSFQTHLRAGSGVHRAFLEARKKRESSLLPSFFSLNPLHRKILEIEKKGFESPFLQKIFVNSHKVKEEILRFYKVDEKKIITIHNGVEWQDLEEPFANWKLEKELFLKKSRLSSKKLHLLFIGNGYERKGLKILLKALSLCKRDDLSLTVIGKEKKISFYQKLCHQLKIEKKVHFFGPQKEILPFYQMADLLAIPSIYDPFANVTVEALAMGLFVISSKQNGGHEVLQKSQGITIDLDEKEALEQWVEALEKAPFKEPLEAVKRRNMTSHLEMGRVLEKIVNELILP